MMRGSDGYILVAVLGTMLVLSGLLASASLVAHAALRGARADSGAAALDGLARGGLELAAYELFWLHLPFAEVNGHTLRFAGGAATPTFTDEAGRIDVNAADPALLSGAFQGAGLGDAAAAALVQRVMSLREAAAQGAAIQAPDAVATPSETAAAAPARPAAASGSTRGNFRSTADFIAFAGVDRDEATGLKALLTTSNPDGKVDALTASRRVLLALPNMSEAQADTILADRKGGVATINRLKSDLGPQALYVKFEPGPCYGVTVVAGDALGRQATRHGIIAASRSPDDPFYTLAWE